MAVDAQASGDEKIGRNPVVGFGSRQQLIVEFYFNLVFVVGFYSLLNCFII